MQLDILLEYKKVMKQFYKNYQRATKSGMIKPEFTNENDFAKAVDIKRKEEVAWFISKYMNTEMISIINDAPDDSNNTKKNGFITGILTYAFSESENSAPHIVIK